MARLQRGGHLPGGDVEGGEQGGGAVPVVVVGAALDQPRLHRQHRHGAVQRLDLGLLVHAQQDRVLRWGQVEPADVGDLADQLRIGGEPERLGSPRLDPVGPPRPHHRGVADPQLPVQQPRVPVRDPQLLRRRLEGRGHDRAVVQRLGPSRTCGIGEPGQSPVLVAVAPQQHRGHRRARQLSDPRVGRALRGQQHDPSALGRRRRDRRRPHPSLQLLRVTKVATPRPGRSIRHAPEFHV